MITTTAIVNSQTWTLAIDETFDQAGVWGGPSVIAVSPQGIRYWIDVQYRQITSHVHTGDCTFGRGRSRCTCAPSVPEPLFQAAKTILLQCFDARETAKRDRPYPLTDETLSAIESAYHCPSAANGGPCTCC